MKTRYTKIDKNPRCLNCGKDAEYELIRHGFFYHYEVGLCWVCLQEHLKKLDVFLNRDKKWKNK